MKSNKDRDKKKRTKKPKGDNFICNWPINNNTIIFFL